MTGRLSAVGVGPGDPGLITLTGAERIRSADVITFFSGTSKTSIARQIADGLITAGVLEEDLRFPVTTGSTDHPGGYFGAIDEFYDLTARRLAAHLDAGRNVTLLAEGDALFYGSFMYIHDRLATTYDVEVVPGITSVSGASAAAATGLSRHEDVLTILPGTLPVPELARRLAATDAAVVMKLGRTFADVREALRQAGCLDRAIYIERATSKHERVRAVADVDPSTVPYMSIILVPGQDRRADSAGRNQSSAPAQAARASDAVGTVFVVGLGPGPDAWLTPEAHAVLMDVEHVVGYGPYIDRIPAREGLTRHASGNTVEVERARLALDLAYAGERVAVVSGGDAGVFGMASAVFEAAEDPRYSSVIIEVVPGVSAAQAVAARAGAPLGADFAVLSLSDRLKPWSVVEDRLRHIAQADLAVALYNPRSRSRPDQLAKAREVLLTVKSPSTVVVVGRHIGREDEFLLVTTLGAFDPELVDMACLIIVGANATQVNSAGRVWTPRFVEEREPTPRLGTLPATEATAAGGYETRTDVTRGTRQLPAPNRR